MILYQHSYTTYVIDQNLMVNTCTVTLKATKPRSLFYDFHTAGNNLTKATP